MRAAARRSSRRGTARLGWRRPALGDHRQQRRLWRARLGPDRPPDDPDQVQDRELEDEHQEDDLDHAAILGGGNVSDV
jgi:hypothetical protein